MPGAAFKIQRLGIEGFKAFAAPQSFEIGGGHVFVFGRNGLGKSSVVEAIRWCLFGLADRAEAEVRNVFYPAGECKVELELEGPGGRWRIQRRLRPGSVHRDGWIPDPGRPQRLPGLPDHHVDRADAEVNAAALGGRHRRADRESHVSVVPENSGIPDQKF